MLEGTSRVDVWEKRVPGRGNWKSNFSEVRVAGYTQGRGRRPEHLEWLKLGGMLAEGGTGC